MPLEVSPTQKDINNYNLSINNLEKIADEFAIGFADWFVKKCSYSGEDSNKGSKYYTKGLDGLALYYPATYTIEELLEIYKKEKGL
jgi:hypothetical protein